MFSLTELGGAKKMFNNEDTASGVANLFPAEFD
jgi:hypothetical protein